MKGFLSFAIDEVRYFIACFVIVHEVVVGCVGC